ncbi:MAG: GNAT family N-acetyltransferase [Chloroflexi bacterium]|nr:GNAT family N-acetyltransferase [Chloroflexota bacterium]
MAEIVVKFVETKSELEGAINVRMRVFVVEQQIPVAEEIDDADATATHAIALYQGQIVGTGRLLYRDDGMAQIGRMAVDRQFRRQGVGGRILAFLEDEARAQGIGSCLLHAQEYVKAFYAGSGYVERGDLFLEADIPHIEMRKEL